MAVASPPTATATLGPTPTATPGGVELLLSVTAGETWELSGLRADVHVLRTEGNVPHIYARDRHDLAFVHGFTVARDRYFMMDLTRRLGLGRVGELIGDRALDSDLESRLTGMTLVADRIAAGFGAEQGAWVDAFAAGVNAYIEQVRARRIPVPSELRLARALLGVSNPVTLMQPFTRRDVAGILAVIVYQSSFETSDVGRTRAFDAMESLFANAPLAHLRRAGLIGDVVPAIDPVHPVGSAAGFGLETGAGFIPGPEPVRGAAEARRTSGASKRSGVSTPDTAADWGALARRLQVFEERLGRRDGFGSNAWAVAGTKTADGASLLAGDGHLQLDVPPIFVQIGLDTSVLGNGSTRQLGLTIPGFPLLAVGTNGQVAWSQTQLSADITDWYREEIRLDESGLPKESLFRGDWRPLRRIDEAYVIANVPALQSRGRTETWARWEIFDGRMVTDIEGRRAGAAEALSRGESLARTLRGLVVPGDTNGDGIVEAVSVDYAAFDVQGVLDGAEGFGHARDVSEFRQQARKLIGYSQNLVAADSQGGILYTAYHAVPCRSYLERATDGGFAPGADPRRLLDGTRYGGFEVPMHDRLPDETAASGDPQRCLVPFDATPQSLSPARGYVLTANNDPGGIAFDRSLENDPWYIGGPWDSGYRADRIRRELEKTVAERSGSVERMAEIQASQHSPLGELLAPYLIEALAYVRQAGQSDRVPAPWEQRAIELYEADAAAFDDVEQRLRAWAEGGYRAASGVETFYHVPRAGEAADAVATMIFNAWVGPFVHAVWDDEDIPGDLFADGEQTRVRILNSLLRARDGEEGEAPASRNPETGESVFFDVLDTPEVETSREMMLRTLARAIAFLRSAPESPGTGGFGTDDMAGWLWGLRHQVRFESLLAPFLGNDPAFAPFTQPFAIDTTKLPLAATLDANDPRRGLRWFPRGGDQWSVDAGNPGLSGRDFTYGSGPVMRMVFALRDGDVSGLNIIPGGQSGLTDSANFLDQARLWLGNRAYPTRFPVSDVVAGASGREVYRPLAQPTPAG